MRCGCWLRQLRRDRNFGVRRHQESQASRLGLKEQRIVVPSRRMERPDEGGWGRGGGRFWKGSELRFMGKRGLSGFGVRFLGCWTERRW